MKRPTLIFSLFVLVLLHSPYSSAETINDIKRADIHRLLEITGALDIGKQMSVAVNTQMAQALKASRPDLPPRLFVVMEEEINGVIDDNLANFAALVAPVYDKHYTHDEIKGLIEFYETELGKKTIQVLPALVQESIQLGQQWGQGLGPEIQRRVVERFKIEGIDLSE